MKETLRMHLKNPDQLEFEAKILKFEPLDLGGRIALDQTCFYSESGGQLGDRGVLHHQNGQIEVFDTQVEDGVVWHYTKSETKKMAQTIRGQVDETHRRDMMQQHSGQHLLSALCFSLFGAETVSARLGHHSSTLDLDIMAFHPQQSLELESQCQTWIEKNVPLKAHFPSPHELDQFKLRKTPTVNEGIRIMEIKGLDQTPCGGTHCGTSAEIGSIIITKWERIRSTMRIHFLAGRRTLRFAQDQRNILERIAQMFGVGASECPDQIERLRGLVQDLNQSNGLLRSKVARQLANQANQLGNEICFHSDDPDLFKAIAKYMAKDAHEPISIFWPSEQGTRFVIEKANAPQASLKSQLEKLRSLGARGGGKDRVEGMIPHSESTERFLKDLPELSDS